MLGPCPKCGDDIYEDEDKYFCFSVDCDFEIKKTILGQALEPDQVTKLLTDGKTDLLTGFVSKAGKKFPAYLVLGEDEDNPTKITFEFPSRDEMPEVPAAKSAQEIKTTGQRLFDSKKYAEALPLLKAAAEALPKDEVLWQQLMITGRDTNQHDLAVEFGKQGIRHHPRSDWLWRELGSELVALNKLDEAEKALEQAKSLNNAAPWLWRKLAILGQKQKDYAKEIEAWETLYNLGGTTESDLNSFAIAYYNNGNMAKAVEYWKLAAVTKPDASYLYYNMGLAFAHPTVSQDADAADAYRRALLFEPTKADAKQNLEKTKQKLAPLAASARRSASGLTQKNDHFQFYLNPFEALQIEDEESDAGADIKTIQRAKKRLLQEICKRRLKSAAGGARKVLHPPGKEDWICRSSSSS